MPKPHHSDPLKINKMLIEEEKKMVYKQLTLSSQSEECEMTSRTSSTDVHSIEMPSNDKFQYPANENADFIIKKPKRQEACMNLLCLIK